MMRGASASSASTSHAPQHKSSQKPPSASAKPISQGSTVSASMVPNKRPRTNKDVEQSTLIDLTEDEDVPAKRYGDKGKARDTGHSSTTTTMSKQRLPNGKERVSEAELEDYKARLAKVEATNEDLQQQLQTLIKMRHTEPERLAKLQKEWYEERYRVDQELIKALREGAESAATPTPAPEKGKGKADATTELVEELQAENTTLREKSNSYQKDLSNKDETIRQLQHELTRARLAAQTPTSTSKTKPNSKSEPNALYNHIVKFYEDLTCLSILGIEGPGSDNKRAFNCMVSPPEVSRTLAFKLRVPVAPPTPGRSGNMEYAVEYEPTSTKHETDVELLKQLDFLTDSFKFTFAQLPEFHKGVMERLVPKAEAEDVEGEDEEEAETD